MVELRHGQRLVWEGWFPEQAQGWWEGWMAGRSDSGR
jgi:hypothetical protein